MAARAALLILALALFAGFCALGTWQVARRAWKLDLIARVEARVHAAPMAAPGRAEWPRIGRARDEYRRVRATGTFLHDRETLVQATTRLGPGHWVLTPLRQADGTFVLVNRGFVPPERRERAARAAGNPDGEVVVIGLLRMTEPGGAFLRDNDPRSDRWHSRDVQAIARARGLDAAAVAPYFIDVEAVPQAAAGRGDAAAAPVGGLTVIAFSNDHLVYAVTWYALALMTAGLTVHLLRSGRRAATAE